ncbi:MAG: hypothetical protein LBR15_07240 [Methanobrevibacter sp.]|nr:hypothetical protein [Candidatus Methanovirga australis]
MDELEDYLGKEGIFWQLNNENKKIKGHLEKNWIGFSLVIFGDNEVEYNTKIIFGEIINPNTSKKLFVALNPFYKNNPHYRVEIFSIFTSFVTNKNFDFTKLIFKEIRIKNEFLTKYFKEVMWAKVLRMKKHDNIMETDQKEEIISFNVNHEFRISFLRNCDVVVKYKNEVSFDKIIETIEQIEVFFTFVFSSSFAITEFSVKTNDNILYKTYVFNIKEKNRTIPQQFLLFKDHHLEVVLNNYFESYTKNRWLYYIYEMIKNSINVENKIFLYGTFIENYYEIQLENEKELPFEKKIGRILCKPILEKYQSQNKKKEDKIIKKLCNSSKDHFKCEDYKITNIYCVLFIDKYYNIWIQERRKQSLESKINELIFRSSDNENNNFNKLEKYFFDFPFKNFNPECFSKRFSLTRNSFIHPKKKNGMFSYEEIYGLKVIGYLDRIARMFFLKTIDSEKFLRQKLNS